MGWFEQFFGSRQDSDMPLLQSAIERAINGVEPLLKQTRGYHAVYRKSVATALQYANSLAASVPGPVVVSRETYAKDPFVHALFPSVDAVMEAFCGSMAVRDYYRQFPGTNELFALMGMRRLEKNIIGMEYSDAVIQRDVVHKMVYFSNHTIESLAPTEKQARDLVALSFFDSLVGKVKKRVEVRKQERQLQLQEMNSLTSRLRTADAQSRPLLEEKLSSMIGSMQSTASLLDLRNYIKDFEAVLLHPEQYLKLNQVPIFLDSMGISRQSDVASQNEAILFSELADFDRRNWTVTMVHCGNMQNKEFIIKLEKASRKLVV